MPVSVTTAATTEPLTTAEAKTHLRVDHSDDDTYIDALILAARVDTERLTWRTLTTTTYTLTLDRFPAGDYIDLPRPPLQSVTSIQYVDTNGDTQTFSTGNYTVNPKNEPGRVYLNYGASWPTARSDNDAITIIYVAGYGDDASDIPELIRQGVRLKVAHWYEAREAVVMGASPVELPVGIRRIDGLTMFRGEFNVYACGLTSP